MGGPGVSEEGTCWRACFEWEMENLRDWDMGVGTEDLSLPGHLAGWRAAYSLGEVPRL
jgi:hypothetical protein